MWQAANNKNAHMTWQARAYLILDFAKILYINGQTTEQILEVVYLLGKNLQINASLLPPRWGELQLIITQDNNDPIIFATAANPVGVNMQRVVPAMTTAHAMISGKLSVAEAPKKLRSIAKKPQTPPWLFGLGAGLGAVALSLLFGMQHLLGLVLIFLSASLGGILRRAIASFSDNIYLQPFAASLLAGSVGALAFSYHISAELYLVAICPCMILVPGPHLLNSALDIIHGRIHLGSARFMCAILILIAISSGLSLGLSFSDVYLPLEVPKPIVSLWKDVLCAGTAVAAYSIFYSTPFSLFAWPLLVGMSAHMLRWASMSLFGASPITGTFYACLMVGIILTIVAHWKKMPFAAMSFAAVVSMLPGIYIFKMTSGLLQLASGSHTTLPLISATISDSLTAILITLVMSVGLLVPKLMIDFIYARIYQ